MSFTRALRWLAVAGLLVGCSDALQLGPQPAAERVSARITIGAQMVGTGPTNASALPAIDNVRIALVRPPADTLRDVVVTVAPGQATVSVELSVNIAGVEESLVAGIQLRSGNTVLYSGQQTVTARAGLLGASPVQTPLIPIVYVGPGASANRIVVEPAQATVPLGASRQFTATGFDAANAPVQDLVVTWTTSDSTIGTVDRESGLFVAGTTPGTVTVRATSPNGIIGEAAVVVVSAGPDPLPGADVVVFNDINIFDDAALADPAADNVRFIRNLVNFTTTGPRNAGTVVMWDCGRLTIHNACVSAQTAATRALITSEGHTLQPVFSSSGTLTSIPPNVKTLWLWMPTVAFTNAEINALKQFAAEGGRVIFIGEFDSFYTAQGLAVENDFLAKMGAVLRNTGGAVDCGVNILPASSLRPHQITEGVERLRIACASVIEPGPDDYPLFYNTGGTLVLGGVAKIDLTPLEGVESDLVSAPRIPSRQLPISSLGP